jgi:hypothetical protein
VNVSKNLIKALHMLQPLLLGGVASADVDDVDTTASLIRALGEIYCQVCESTCV